MTAGHLVDLENKNLICLFCGAVRPFQFGEILEVEEALDDFRKEHSDCLAKKGKHVNR
jgi:hypothetical protein